MSQVDDWSDGYTSDYLRDLNTYGPASANVPRSGVVSHQVRYRAPDTSDIPLAPGQNPEDSVYSNASGARMGQIKPASGYRAPAGGGWDVNSSDANLRFSNESGGKQYRVSRTQTAKKTVKKQAQPDKKQPQSEYRTGGARTPEENEIARSAAEHRTGADLGQLSSQALDAAARFLPALKLLGFGAGAGSASVPETNFNRGLMGGVGRQVESMRAPDSEQPAPESSSIADQFKNMPWYKDAKAYHEAAKKNVDDHGYVLGTLKSTWDDIPWWTKLVMLPPVFKAGSLAAGASTTGNVWAEGGLAAAGDATAGAKAFEEALSHMNGGAVRGAPVEGTARRSFSSAAEGRRLYGPVAERLLAPNGSLTGGARTTLTSADEGLPVGYSLLRESPKGTSAWRGAAADYGVSPAGGSVKLDLNGMPGAAGREVAAAGGQAADWTSNLAQQLRAAGIPEDQIAASIARINAGAAGREAAAAGGQAAGREAAAAGEQAAGREAATASEAAADGGVSELANAGNAGRSSADEAMRVAESLDELVRSIKSGTVDEMGKAWIEALARQKAAGFESETINDVLAAARAAGILGRDAAGTVGREAAAGAGRAGEAAGGAPKTGAGEAAGTLSAQDRLLYNAFINRVQDDPGLVDLVPSTLHRVVGNAARSIDSLSDAELSAFYKALNDAVDSRQIASLFIGGL